MVVIVAIVLLGVGLGWVGWRVETLGRVAGTQQVVEVKDTCEIECQREIRNQIAELRTQLRTEMHEIVATLAAMTTTKPVAAAKTVAKKKVRTVQYVAVPGAGGSTQSMIWSDVGGSDFYFDKAEYPGLVEIYFEANMRLSGSGMAYVRLADVTHGISVQGSDVQTKNNTDSVLESGKLNFWAGKNLIRVQVRSVTTELATFNSGRLKVVMEN